MLDIMQQNTLNIISIKGTGSKSYLAINLNLKPGNPVFQQLKEKQAILLLSNTMLIQIIRGNCIIQVCYPEMCTLGKKKREEEKDIFLEQH